MFKEEEGQESGVRGQEETMAKRGREVSERRLENASLDCDRKGAGDLGEGDLRDMDRPKSGCQGQDTWGYKVTVDQLLEAVCPT